MPVVTIAGKEEILDLPLSGGTEDDSLPFGIEGRHALVNLRKSVSTVRCLSARNQQEDGYHQYKKIIERFHIVKLWRQKYTFFLCKAKNGFFLIQYLYV